MIISEKLARSLYIRAIDHSLTLQKISNDELFGLFMFAYFETNLHKDNKTCTAYKLALDVIEQCMDETKIRYNIQ